MSQIITTTCDGCGLSTPTKDAYAPARWIANRRDDRDFCPDCRLPQDAKAITESLVRLIQQSIKHVNDDRKLSLTSLRINGIDFSIIEDSVTTDASQQKAGDVIVAAIPYADVAYTVVISLHSYELTEPDDDQPTH